MFENINIAQVVIHEVFKRGPNREIVDPVFGEQEILLDAEAMTALRDRLIKALGQSSRCMEMDLQIAGEGSGVDLAKRLLEAGESFALASREVAIKFRRSDATRSAWRYRCGAHRNRRGSGKTLRMQA